MMKHPIIVLGVPEHYNAPWRLVTKQLKENNIKIIYKDEPGGTGAMCQKLENGEAHMALLLTEGAVYHVGKSKSNVKIAGMYVDATLPWGIHMGAQTSISTLEELIPSKTIFAISRFGSGSHIMAFLLARKVLKWPKERRNSF